MTRKLLKHKWKMSYVDLPFFYLPDYNGGGGSGGDESDFEKLKTSVMADFSNSRLMGGTHAISMAYCDGIDTIYLRTYNYQQEFFYNDKPFATLDRLGGTTASDYIFNVANYHNTTPHKGYIIFTYNHSGSSTRSTTVEDENNNVYPLFSIYYDKRFIDMEYPIKVESGKCSSLGFSWRAWLNLETLEIRQCAYLYYSVSNKPLTKVFLPESATGVPLGDSNLLNIAQGKYDTDEYSSRVGFLQI